MITKTCFKCHKSKERSEFYRHSRMSDGLLGKCKSCTRTDVHKNYTLNREYYAAYERDRAQDPTRKEQALRYQRNQRLAHPVKSRARNVIGAAIRDGLLQRKPCEICAALNTQAHHIDYRKPLEVRWLCFKHHREAHGQTVQ